MNKNLLRIISWLSSSLLAILILIFVGNIQALSDPNPNLMEKAVLILWILGAVISTISGLLFLITEKIHEFTRRLNIASALIFLVFTLLLFFFPWGKMAEFNFFEIFLAFLFFLAPITRIVAEVISAWDFIKSYSYEEQINNENW